MFKTTLIVTAGILMGAGSVQMLHAQMKPPAYQIAIIDVKDDAGYAGYKQAVADVRKRIGDMGGKFIVTAGAGGGGG